MITPLEVVVFGALAIVLVAVGFAWGWQQRNERFDYAKYGRKEPKPPNFL